mmetsp:Transcript_61324/g.150095  ORF Transcript_61324/g.150095 Transcript_61324/m.150095 type:complete len:558 (-) Transcript_61324:149-1822(-)
MTTTTTTATKNRNRTRQTKKKKKKIHIRAPTPEIKALMQAAVDGNLLFIVNHHEKQQHQELEEDQHSENLCESTDIIRIQDAKCDSGCSILHWAAGNDQVHVVRYAVERLHMDVNQQATHRLTIGRTPMHYAARNGCIETVKVLYEEFHADPDSRALDNVSPFQLAVWQNQLDTCQYLVDECNGKVDPLQVNDFGCAAVHWIGICPFVYNDETRVTQKRDSHTNDYGEEFTAATTTVDMNKSLIPLARWLSSINGMDFRKTQSQGHNALHKAAWGKHLELIKYLRDVHDMWDEIPDVGGNYAADVASMSGSPELADFIRRECSRERHRSCRVLGVPIDATQSEIRKAYLSLMKVTHPDKQHHHTHISNMIDHATDRMHELEVATDSEQNGSSSDSIVVNDVSSKVDEIVKAYEHLTKQNGYGTQRNPNHSLKLMLEWRKNDDGKHDEPQSAHLIDDRMGHNGDGATHRRRIFQARLRAVLLEFGEKGCPLDNIQKKWNQVWGPQNIPFPYQKGTTKCKLSRFLVKETDGMVKLVGKQPVVVQLSESCRKRARDETQR